MHVKTPKFEIGETVIIQSEDWDEYDGLKTEILNRVFRKPDGYWAYTTDLIEEDEYITWVESALRKTKCM